MTNEPHIGHLIKEELRNQGRTITWLAKQLDCSRQNAYKILNRPWIYTDLLLKISSILDYDFFKCFSDNFSRRPEMKFYHYWAIFTSFFYMKQYGSALKWFFKAAINNTNALKKKIFKK